MESVASSRIRGELRIGEIVSLPPGPIVVRGIELVSPRGEVVMKAEELRGELDLSGIFDGELRLAPAEIIRAEIRLTEGPGQQVAFIHALEVPEDRLMVPMVLADTALVDNRIHIDLPGKPAVDLTSVNGVAELRVGHQFVGRLDENRGDIEIISLDVADFRDMSGRIKSDHRQPIKVEGILDVELAEPAFRITYHAPAVAGDEGEARLDLDWPDELRKERRNDE